MSNQSDALKALAGTLTNDRGGEATVQALTDVVVKYQHDAVDAAANTTFNKNIYRNTLGVDLRLVEAIYIPDAALTAADATKLTLSIKKGAAGAVTTEQATVNTATEGGGGTGDWVADTPEALTLSATAANLVLANNEIVCVDKAVTGAGTALVAGCLQLKYRRV